MKILAIVGSYRQHGNTARAVSLILDEMRRLAAAENAALESETIFLGDLEIGQCRGCRVCFDRGETKCPLRDDLLAVREKMLNADGLIVASPIYVDDVSGLTKTWIDRLAHLCHRPALARQSALLVTTTGGSPCGHALRTLNTALMTWGVHIAGQAGFKMGALMRGEEVDTLRAPARRSAKQLFNAVSRRAAEQPSFLSLMMFRIQQISWSHSAQGSIDYAYWEGNGWLDGKREFYLPHRAPRVKAAAARWVGGVVHRLVT